MGERFGEDEVFYYNYRRKVIESLALISFILFIILAIGVYVLYLKDKDVWFLRWIRLFFVYLYSQVTTYTLKGAFISSLIGGLVFVTVPTEVVFAKFMLHTHKPYFLLVVYLLGLFLSYNVNYYLGKKLVGLSKRAIGVKKFYSIKGMINRKGGVLIFLFYAIPFMPSQALTTILGVFNYPLTRFYLLFFIGQFLKYFSIILFYKWVVA